MDLSRTVVFVVEPDLNLADALHDILISWGLQAATFPTHRAAAASAQWVERIDLLAACIPASDDHQDGAYLEEAKVRQGGELPVILMLNEPDCAAPPEVRGAVRLRKPFTPYELWAAMEHAGVTLATFSRPP